MAVQFFPAQQVQQTLCGLSALWLNSLRALDSFRCCRFLRGLTLVLRLCCAVGFSALYNCPLEIVSDHPRKESPPLVQLLHHFHRFSRADPPSLTPFWPVICCSVLPRTSCRFKRERNQSSSTSSQTSGREQRTDLFSHRWIVTKKCDELKYKKKGEESVKKCFFH